MSTNASATSAVVRAVPAASASPTRWTEFFGFGAAKKVEHAHAWSDLIERLRRAGPFPSKDRCPWVKLATFGAVPSDKGSLRHDTNVLTVTGVEGDHDAGTMSPDEAVAALERAGVRALIYTSPSHRPESPRWRVLAPLSGPHEPAQRRALMARINGVLGGCLAGESFTLSQAYFYGRVSGAVDYRVIATFDDPTEGEFVDLLDELDNIAIAKRLPAATTLPGEPGVAPRHAPVRFDDAQHLVERLGRLLRSGDGRRELLKRYIASRSARGFSKEEIAALVAAFAASYFDPESQTDDYRIEELIEWATMRDSARPAPPAPVIEDVRDPDPEPPVEWLEQAPDDAMPESDPVELDLAALAGVAPQPPWFMVDGLLPGEEITLLAADGGTFKSQLALQLAVCRAAGLPFFGLAIEEGSVDFVSFEDRPAVLHWRLSRICRTLEVDLAALAGRLRLFDATETSTVWAAKQLGIFSQTAAFERIRHRIGGPDRLVIVDGLADVFGGDENDRGQAKAFLRLLRTLIGQRGALLVLAHVDKAAARTAGGDALGYSGSTGWSNGVRSRIHMFREGAEDGETGRLIAEVKKTNLAAKGARLTLRFDPEAMVLVDASDADGCCNNSPPFRKSAEAEAILRTIRDAYEAGDPIPAATSGQRTAHSVADVRGLPPSLSGKRGRTRFNRAIEELRQAGAVVRETQRRANRHHVEVLRARD